MRVLVACEESDSVRSEFDRMGFDAWSCDLFDCVNPDNKKHLKGDVLKYLHLKWHLVIAFPPCTDLAVSGARHFEAKRKDGRQQMAIDFFMKFVNCAQFCAVENPVGIMSSVYRKPDQIIHPFYFGDSAKKRTCLWLNNLPLLKHDVSDYVYPGDVDKNGFPVWMYNNCARHRSKTFPGIAKAMALQWGDYVKDYYGLLNETPEYI
ncbi:DNA cytosine methyltransferase [Elizabethkingia miricola]|nr:DNA cytosine methyltransferase [Elizabethkingia miricola]